MNFDVLDLNLLFNLLFDWLNMKVRYLHDMVCEVNLFFNGLNMHNWFLGNMGLGCQVLLSGAVLCSGVG